MIADVLPDHDAISLLLSFEARGFRLLRHPAGIYVEPSARLTDADRAIIRRHKAELRALLAIFDDGVVARRRLFELQWALRDDDRPPAFLFESNVPYALCICFSCGDRLESARWGRCWRCALAWRLALGVPITSKETASADEAKVVA
jgi:hypothetical protein